MKKSIFAIIFLLTFIANGYIFADEPKFTRASAYGYIYGCRLYDSSEYLNGNYRTNFICIPQNRMLNHLDGFQWKVGVFELDGNTLYLGWSGDGTGHLLLCDANKKFYITADSYLTEEESFFRYNNGIWGGIVKEIELKGKKYTVAVAGLSSSKLGIFSDTDGFRMWLENEPQKDTALSKKSKSGLIYNSADIREGVYKPGWKRLWGTYAYIDEVGNTIFKYNYKGFDFVVDYNHNAAESLLNMDGSKINITNGSEGFHIYQPQEDGKDSDGVGIGFEADVQLGNNKVRIAIISCNGKWIFVKDTSGYPVIQNEKSSKANSKTKAKKTEKTKKSGKSAAFTRDYEKYRRIYSDSDISKGIYKSNYKNIPQNGSEGVSFKVNMKEEGEVTLSCKTGIFDIDDFKISIFYNLEKGWQIIPKSENIKSLSYTTNNSFDLSSEKIRMGMQSEVTVIINDKEYDLAFVCLNAGKGDYRVFLKTDPNEETALSETDNFGIEYFDIVDILAGVYKPNFEFIERSVDKDESHKALFKDATDDDPVFIFDYKGYKFLIGSTQDPANYVKNLDGSVIYNPETQLRFIIRDKNGNTSCHQGISYGWEGNVKLGDKDVTLAYFKWGAAVCAFVKE